jgi:hypothetical protein
MYDIASFDRQKYEETFGRYTHFMPNEIISIKHGRSVLYET